MEFIKFKRPKGLDDELKAKEIFDFPSLDEVYIGFEKPKRRIKK